MCYRILDGKYKYPPVSLTLYFVYFTGHRGPSYLRCPTAPCAVQHSWDSYVQQRRVLLLVV